MGRPLRSGIIRPRRAKSGGRGALPEGEGLGSERDSRSEARRR